MRVAINLEQVLHDAPGGIGRYSAALARLLPDTPAGAVVAPFVAWHKKSAITRAWNEWELDTVGYPAVIPVPRPALYDAWHTIGAPTPWALAPALRGVDLVHAPSVAVPPTEQVPLVVTVHDAAPVVMPEAFTRRGRWFHARGFAAAAKRATVVITVSEFARDEIAAHTPIPADRIRVVPNGVDLGVAADADVASVRVRYGLGDAPFILWAGVLQPRKNVGVLVDAFAKFVAAGDRSEVLVLAGPDGWLDPGIDAALDALGGRVRRLGAVPPAELRALYRGAAAFALPSRHEGFGLPLLEAMAQGTPTIAADIGSLREVGGGIARYVPVDDVAGWADTLAEVVDLDLVARATIAEAARLRAAEFSWRACVERTRDVYEEALGG